MTSKMCLATRNVCFALIAALAAHTATGATVDASSRSMNELQELDEVWVHGERIVQRIEAAEDDFFALYNDLNTRRRYDVRCGVTALSRDSMIMVRKCAPEFRMTYTSFYVPNPSYGSVMCRDNASFRGSWNAHFDSCFGAAGREVMVMPASRENQAEYARHVLAVIHSDQRLLDKVGELAALYDELESTRKRYVDLKPPRKSTRPRTHPRAL